MSHERGVAPTAAPMVSVVLPVYNAEPWLAESVGSILEQTYRDFELIAIDDGSTDRSRQLLAELTAGDSRVRLLANETNRGLIATLNRGMKAARSPLVARHDADDIALPNRLERQVAYLSRHGDVGLLATAHIRRDVRGRQSVCRPPRGDTEIRWRLLLGNVWCHPTIMLRRELIEGEAEVYRDFPHAEDFELWVRLLGKTRGATLAEPLVVIREHGQSVSKQNAIEQTRVVERICLQQLGSLLPLAELDSSAIQRLRRARRGRLGSRPAATCRLLLELFDAFAKQPGIDAIEAGSLRRQWLARVMMVTPVAELRALARAGELGRLIALGPASAARGLFLSRPRHTLRRAMRRLRR